MDINGLPAVIHLLLRISEGWLAGRAALRHLHAITEKKRRIMDYGKSGNPRQPKSRPEQGTGKPPAPATNAGRPTKEDLLARMKAAAEAKPNE
jgi:hypothetical protein